MDFRRPSTPSLQVGHELSAPLPPSPPGGPLPHALALPPSCLPTPSPPFTFTPVNPPAVRPRPTVNIRAALAGFKRSQTAGIQNPVVKAKKAKIASAFMVDKASQDKVKIGLMDLPGEIRNRIYSLAHSDGRQALLIHRPRLASLRPRTQLDRLRTPASTLAEDSKSVNFSNESGRPFFSLTQVSRQLRAEFRPLYMQTQDIGIDLVEIGEYLQTFYPNAPEQLRGLPIYYAREFDLPYYGNLTIAVGNNLKDAEMTAEGINVLPLLDLWANSCRIEAAFGRYMDPYYRAHIDGEAKDLYRLFGRQVHKDRRCGSMNVEWRSILRTRSLAAVRIHRKAVVTAPSLAAPFAAYLSAAGPLPTRPYIHILFRKDAAEPWMTLPVSAIPPHWLTIRGFDRMEYFQVRVGVE